MLSEDELLDWMAMYALDPWGAERADLNAGIIAATIANVNRDPRRGKPISPADMMPKYGQSTGMPDPKELKQQFLSTFKIKRKGRPSADPPRLLGDVADD